MWEAKLTSKGQITVPKPMRDHLKLKPGDQLQFIIDRKGRVMLVAQTIDINDFFGMFHYKSKKKSLTQKDIDEAITKRMRKKFKEILNDRHRH